MLVNLRFYSTLSILLDLDEIYLVANYKVTLLTEHTYAMSHHFFYTASYTVYMTHQTHYRQEVASLIEDELVRQRDGAPSLANSILKNSLRTYFAQDIEWAGIICELAPTDPKEREVFTHNLAVHAAIGLLADDMEQFAHDLTQTTNGTSGEF